MAPASQIRLKSAELLISTLVGLLLALYVAYYLLDRLVVSSVDSVAVLLVLIFRVILAGCTSAEGSRIKSFKKT
ncbi:uncharacterized protein RSE6_14549 [Rhynchosporium secalis]|uniref:Uncharacterized protein n=1 Tax=Rhynchosporium secalis TaxID=38038 RepID=A0A1E1MVK0_RHYSE|nr:uncharacterized protein RSE6_14549 [Rhynchosporium secalis]